MQRRPCRNLNDCNLAIAEQMTRIAAHWGDVIDPAEGITSGFLEGQPQWQSYDLTKSYSLSFHYADKGPKSREIAAEATRWSCRATSPPYPPDVPISCRNLSSDFGVTQQEAKAIAETPEARPGGWRMDTPQEASRTALQDADIIGACISRPTSL
jgi:hypothetical protein